MGFKKLDESGRDKKNGKWTNGGGHGKPGYLHGPFYRGDGFTFLSDEDVRREFTWMLSDSTACVLRSLNTRSWDTRHLLVKASRTFLVNRTLLGKRSIDRHLAILLDYNFIFPVREDFDKGHEYFVEPVFIWSSKWHELQHIELSILIPKNHPRQNGAAKQTAPFLSTHAKMALLLRQNGVACDESSGTDPRQNGVQSRSDLFRRNGAQRHIAKEKSEGGEDLSERRGPNGHDHNGNGTEGVPSGDDIEKAAIGIAALNAEFERRGIKPEKRRSW